MRFLTNKSFVQKIIIAIVLVILFNFAVPIRAQAFLGLEQIGLDLLKELVHLIAALGDVVTRCIESFYVRNNSNGRFFYARTR